MTAAVQRSWLPFVLLGAAVAGAIVVARQPPASSPAAGASPESPAPSASPGIPARVDPPLSDLEMRESRVHLAHELCEQAAKHVNEIEGRTPTDPKGINTITMCLGHGNVAWYKCILRASKHDDVGTCNRRLLVGENQP
jgi:hypothetical protein